MADEAPKTHGPDGRAALPARLARAWRGVPADGRLAAGAAALLFLTMFLPWYQQNVVVSDRGDRMLQSQNLSAFGVFSFVEAAVLLVAAAVLVLLFARAEGRGFHLPGGDGLIVTAAGGWVALLLVWRLFDKPDLQGSGVGNMGIQWGIFFALGAAGLLAWSGVRMRAAERPAAPARRERPRRRRTPPPGTERTRPLPPERQAARPLPRERDAPAPDRDATQPLPPEREATRPLPRERDAPAPDRDATQPLPPPPAAPDAAPTRRLPREPQAERLWDDR